MNKRKGRGTSIGKGDRAGPPRNNISKTPDKEIKENSTKDGDSFVGVFANARLTHSLTALIGNVMRVETQNYSEYEGIFKTFSSKCDLVLELVHKIDPESPDCVDVSSVEDKMVFPLKSIIRFYALDVDLDYATKETFLTDAQISGNKMNGEAPMKKLEEWEPEEDGDPTHSLEMDAQSSNGWSAQEMFAKNEQFGVKTSYDPNMAAYTVQLNKEKMDSQEYRDKEKRAERIAAEIEGNEKSRAHIELENGDEEEAFSAVQRPRRDRESPADDKSSSTYVPPGRRESSRGHSRGGGGGGRGGGQQRTTPPGSRTTPPPRHERYDHSHAHNEDFRYNRHDRDGRDQRNDRYSGGGGGRGGYRDDRGYNSENRGGYGKEEGGGGRYSKDDARGYKDDGRGYKDDGRGYKDDGRGYKDDGRGYKDDGRGYKDDGRGYKDDGRGYKEEGRGYKEEGRNYERVGYSRQDSHGKDSKAFSPQQQPRPGSSHDQRKEEKKPEKVSPVPELTVDKPGPDRRRSGEYSKSPDTQIDGGGLPQRDQRKRGEKTKEQSMQEFKEFHSKFNLKVGEGGGGGGGPSPLSPTTPTVSIKGATESQQPLSSPVSADAKIPTPRPSPKASTPTGQQQASPPHHQHLHQATPSATPNSSSSINNSSNSTDSASPTSSLAETVKKSTLNPNAKEFTLNPTAKEFTPRSVIAPRPQTPGTPAGQMTPNMYSNMIPTMQGQPAAAQMYVPSVPHASFISANTNNQQRPIRPSSKEGGHSLQQRPDLPSPIQVQQMTGPPLLAPTIQSTSYGFQPNMTYVLGPGQPPMRMMVPPAMMSTLMPTMMSVAGPNPGIDTMSQSMASNQYQHTAGQVPPPQLWPQVMTSHAGQPHPHAHNNGPPGPPHNSMAPTPPAQPHTPAPSPGPQTIIGYHHGAHTGQPGSLQYPMIIMNNHNMGYHQSAPPIGPGQMIGQPVTSIANMAQHFQYMPQGGQPLPSMLPQPGHHQQ